MEVVTGDAFGNNLRSNQWHSDDNISKLGTWSGVGNGA
jgi:hypothetical protein